MDFKVTVQDRRILYADNPDIVGENSGGVEPVTKSEPAAGVKFGITVRELTEDERNMTPDKHGIMVTSVPENSFGEDIELEKGDIILAINRHPVGSIDDLRKITGSLKSGDAVAVLMVRPAEESARTQQVQGGTKGRRGSANAPAASVQQETPEPEYKSGRLP